MESKVNPWVRADMERFAPETLELIPDADRPEYTSVMQQLAHWKGIFSIVQENLQQAEQNRHAFFDRVVYGIEETPPATPVAVEVPRGGPAPELPKLVCIKCENDCSCAA